MFSICLEKSNTNSKMKFKRLTTEVGEGSLQMFRDEMFAEVFELNIMVVFVVMEMVLVLQYYGVPLHLLFMTSPQLKEFEARCKENDANILRQLKESVE
ncbi:hypothetical protein CMV_015264 [Castanea mollissima]|uniref:Transmembrane protein n=1 Tax=Castanea mollissima TaxID=60419 RepID=A0A8J4R9X4_9ROSI|nr:hypothetical protein CMV_015264 [Castanea mollissima]